MKISMSMAATAVAVVVLASGCRYDKANSDETGDADAAKDIPTQQGVDVKADVDESATSGTLDDLAAAGKSFKDRGYALCTDVSFTPVYFAFDATSIRPEELGKIEAVARHLLDNPDRVVSIEGNCDERGSNEYNMSLGEDRAIIISNFLAQNGIARERMETISRGETNPAAEGTGESVWSKNRRGEFVIWKK